MAKAGGRRKTAARLFCALLVLCAALPGALAGQRPLLRAGVVLSGPLARDAIGGGASAVTVRARPAPLLGAALLVPLRERLELELGGGAAFSRLRVEDAAGSRDVQGLTVAQALVALRYGAGPRPYLRGGVGALRYFTPARGIFGQGNGLHPALEAGLGWTRPAGAWRAGAELTAQLHPFDTPALRSAGAGGGGVTRLALTLVLTRGGRP